MAQTKKPSPPTPPKLPAKEQVAAALTATQNDEGSAVEQLHAHLTEAHESIAAALDLLDQAENE